jgi:hypothetical protein
VHKGQCADEAFGGSVYDICPGFSIGFHYLATQQDERGLQANSLHPGAQVGVRPEAPLAMRQHLKTDASLLLLDGCPLPQVKTHCSVSSTSISCSPSLWARHLCIVAALSLHGLSQEPPPARKAQKLGNVVCKSIKPSLSFGRSSQ